MPLPSQHGHVSELFPSGDTLASIEGGASGILPPCPPDPPDPLLPPDPPAPPAPPVVIASPPQAQSKRHIVKTRIRAHEASAVPLGSACKIRRFWRPKREPQSPVPTGVIRRFWRQSANLSPQCPRACTARSNTLSVSSVSLPTSGHSLSLASPMWGH